MRSGRLLTILLVLQARGRVTAAALAEELEVSERTIHRDMDALSMAGVPVYAERGARGGWLLPPEYRSGPRGLDADELRALFLSAPGTVLGDLGLDRASESALTKLMLAVPAASRREMTEARQKIIVDLSTWRASEAEPTPCLARLHEALSRDRQVQISYLRADGARVERCVSPLGLVAKGLIWYLVGAGDDGHPRTYRVSRVVAATLSDAPTCIPDGFDLAAFWEASKARLVAGVPRFRVQFRAQSSVVHELERAGRWSRLVSVTDPDGFDLAAFWEASKARLVAGVPRFRVQFRAQSSVVHELERAGRWSRLVSVTDPDAHGWVDVEMDFELEEDACALALSFGSKLELVSPSALRARVAGELAAAVRRYAPANSD